MKPAITLTALLLAPLAALDAAEASEKELPLPGEVFAVDGCTAFVIPAKATADGEAKPWVWYAPTLPSLPGDAEKWMFEKFTGAGIAIAGIDAGESYGSPAGNAVFSALFAELTGKRGYSRKPVLLGRSRGGLMTLSWAAENPDKVADPKRPRVLLIGDSILNGYLKQAAAALEGKAYVDAWVNPYHQSEHLNKLLAEVLAHGPYDVVHFNMGLHGWPEGRIKPGTFEPLTKAYVEVLRAKLPKARLIWASSTPVTKEKQSTELEPDINPIIVEHNRMAAKVMAEMNVPVNDFYALLVNKRELARGDRFHWTAPAYELLAKTVAEAVLRELEEPKAAASKKPPFNEKTIRQWTLAGPLGECPKRVSEALPLSDQQDRGGWVKFTPMWDEFDGPTLDTNQWIVGMSWWRGRQPAWFSPSNVAVSAGQLHLTMRKEAVPPDMEKHGYKDYTSAALHTRARLSYGYYEVKSRAMNSGGSSSFWFQQEDQAAHPGWGTEIDVFELCGKSAKFERQYHMNAHVFKTPQEQRHWSVGGTWTAPWRFTDDFHVFGFEWTREELRWYVDGVLVRTVQNTHWHQPLHLIFDSETMPEWFGMPEDADLPSTFSIEYVCAWPRTGPDAPPRPAAP